MRLLLQLIASAALFIAVIWAMWRVPTKRGESLLPFAPSLALLSVWMGVIALLVSSLLWVLPYPDQWVAIALLVLDPAAVASGVLVLWVYRGHDVGGEDGATVSLQRLQARVGLALAILAIAVGYAYVMTHKAPGTVVNQ